MGNKTAEDFTKAIKEKGNCIWDLRECSICGYMMNYRFDNSGNAYLDTGCDCVSYGPVIREIPLDQIVDDYNLQTNEEVIKEMNEFWGFSE